MSQPSVSTKKRLIFIFVSVCVVIFGLIIRLGWIQIVQGERYKELANAQQTRDIPIPSKRGTIYDRNGKELAISASSNTVWAKPREIDDAEEAASVLSEILELDEEETFEKLKDTRYGLVRIARWIDDDVADSIRTKKVAGVWIAEDNKRYYPYGNFAAYVLGHTTDDNKGMAGVELEYEKYLSGLPGRWIKNTDGAGRQLAFSVERYYPPEDGLNLVLTIDEVIQHFAEKAVENALEINQAKRVTAIVMDIKTGDILAMAVKPDYDPNEPRTPLDDALRLQIEEMDNEKKLEAWFSMWRNPATNDTYEPGSTFKLITVASALEEGVATPQSQFYSGGTVNVAGQIIKCWRYYNPHGQQTLIEAVQNSCNPVMVELSQRMGAQTFYKYLNGFGFSDTTGVDLPGERKSIMYNINNVGPVELATISFGQSISVTPIQLISAVSAIANDGKLMKPRIVKELVDAEGKIIHRFEETIVRQVISQKTSEELLDIMESVVSEGSGKNAYIPGYKVGGKTGTAQKVVNGRYAQGIYVSSFIGVAPADDPRLAVLAIVDEPGGYSHFGSVVATPIAKSILEESLRYLDIKPKYSEEEAKTLIQNEVVIPDVRGLTVKEGSQILSQNKLDHATWPEISEDGDSIIVDMFPKPSAKVPEKSIIMLYTKMNENLPSAVVVPDLKGKTIREANTVLNAMGLKLKITGSGLVNSQVPEAGTEVEPGTIVSVEFKPD
ncbi:stage V sporulation protein D (sporulation-specific penicillin-binding protein) [Anaerovirgula multivorans]|uniref:Stage V sporulation protein D (Sporulation-specific penicillin-binding protein) n=1 Tax=Anaerovirgula multivorans TaxID=312168 RepID=A0A239CXD8_9FIRM|nr:stage V sporulation protein D [Anaerovirgula multivorans]SNS24589.1 stage V sporulation protein D (sporulation-specific penicillin-binding protein) [Anaerovirgula multivorans]